MNKNGEKLHEPMGNCKHILRCKDREVLHERWTEIGREMKASWTTAKERWRPVRDQVPPEWMHCLTQQTLFDSHFEDLKFMETVIRINLP